MSSSPDEPVEGLVQFGTDDFVNPHDAARERRQVKAQRQLKGFAKMNLHPALLKGVRQMGYSTPTPIQKKVIPMFIKGVDIVAMARTGSGKSAAFLIPVIHRILENAEAERRAPDAFRVQAVLLSPTRELALQLHQVLRSLASRCANLISSVVLVGGQSIEKQFGELTERKPSVIIGTPGRFLHVQRQMGSALPLSHLHTLVFDEADKLFEMGFAQQLHAILEVLPSNRQAALFSATMPKMVVEFTKAGLRDPELVRLDTDNRLPPTLRNSFFRVKSDARIALLVWLLREKVLARDQQCLVFVATRYQVLFVKSVLEGLQLGNPTFVYGQLVGQARQENLDKFRSGESRVMVVTDLAARGLDIEDLDCVVNYHFPDRPKLFVHRVGRIARAGKTGVAYSFVGPSELPYLLDCMLVLNLQCPAITGGSEQKGARPIDYGTAPRTVLDGEMQSILRTIRERHLSRDLENAVNSMKEYGRSKKTASRHSVRRSRQIPESSVPQHPMFVTMGDDGALNAMLASIRDYKSRQTIFEAKRDSYADIDFVKEIRRSHKEIIDKAKSTKELEEAARQQAPDAAVEESKSKQSSASRVQLAAAPVDNGAKRLSKAERRKLKKQKAKQRKAAQSTGSISNAVPQPPSHVALRLVNNRRQTVSAPSVESADTSAAASERYEDTGYYLQSLPGGSEEAYIRDKAFSVSSGNSKRLEDHVFEVNADDVDALQKQRRQQVWVRKKRKFVMQEAGGADGPVGGRSWSGKLKTRNEAGQLVRDSLKSRLTARGGLRKERHENTFDRWRKGQVRSQQTKEDGGSGPKGKVRARNVTGSKRGRDERTSLPGESGLRSFQAIKKYRIDQQRTQLKHMPRTQRSKLRRDARGNGMSGNKAKKYAVRKTGTGKGRFKRKMNKTR